MRVAWIFFSANTTRIGIKFHSGNIPFNATKENSRGLLSRIGEVASVNLITDPHNGRLKGFGFVEMTNEADARKSIPELNGTVFPESSFAIDEAKHLKQR